MIIDCDTHISPHPEGKIGINAEELIERLDKAGVDKAFSWPYYPYERERLPEYNRYVYESMQKYPQRIAGFAWIDPSLKGAAELTRTCMQEYGLYGIKLNGSQNLFRYDDLSLLAPIVDEVAKSGGLVAMHVGADCPQRTHPYFALRLAKAYPDTTFLFVHMGGVSYPDISDCAVEAALEAKNVHLLGSHIGYVSVLKAIHRLGAHRVSFASDAPFNLMHAEKAGYLAMLSDSSPEDTALVMGGNAERILAQVKRTD